MEQAINAHGFRSEGGEIGSIEDCIAGLCKPLEWDPFRAQSDGSLFLPFVYEYEAAFGWELGAVVLEKPAESDVSFLEKTMNCNQVLKIIAEHREKLATEFGVKSLALFGSVVRDEAMPTSDVDLLVEFDGRPVGLFHLSRTQHYLESIFGISKVDLVLRDGIKPALKERILREAINAT